MNTIRKVDSQLELPFCSHWEVTIFGKFRVIRPRLFFWVSSAPGFQFDLELGSETMAAPQVEGHLAVGRGLTTALCAEPVIDAPR